MWGSDSDEGSGRSSGGARSTAPPRDHSEDNDLVSSCIFLRIRPLDPPNLATPAKLLAADEQWSQLDEIS
jgi:hypothetical protein